jgi:hypothetical protein
MRQIVPMATAVLTAVMASQASNTQAQEAPIRACALLSATEIRKLTAQQDYSDGEEGDAPGEGLGGGSSCGYGLPGDWPPRLAVVLIPAHGGEGWTRRRRGVKLYEGCKREQLSGIGDDAFAELCPKDSGPTVYAKAGGYDVVVQLKVVAPATAASVKPTAVAVAKAAVAKLQ